MYVNGRARVLVPETRTMLPFSRYRLLSQVPERMLGFVQMPDFGKKDFLGPDRWEAVKNKNHQGSTRNKS